MCCVLFALDIFVLSCCLSCCLMFQSPQKQSLSDLTKAHYITHDFAMISTKTLISLLVACGGPAAVAAAGLRSRAPHSRAQQEKKAAAVAKLRALGKYSLSCLVAPRVLDMLLNASHAHFAVSRPAQSRPMTTTTSRPSWRRSRLGDAISASINDWMWRFG